MQPINGCLSAFKDTNFKANHNCRFYRHWQAGLFKACQRYKFFARCLASPQHSKSPTFVLLCPRFARTFFANQNLSVALSSQTGCLSECQSSFFINESVLIFMQIRNPMAKLHKFLTQYFFYKKKK